VKAATRFRLRIVRGGRLVDVAGDDCIQSKRSSALVDAPDRPGVPTCMWLVENNVLHPRASSFIYFPEHQLGPEYEGRSLTPEKVVDHVLAYKPIELGPPE
jgi:hypothetical protein